MSILSELRRRNVFKVGVAYALVAWIIAQVASIVVPALRLPEWVMSFVVVVLVAGDN